MITCMDVGMRNAMICDLALCENMKIEKSYLLSSFDVTNRKKQNQNSSNVSSGLLV